MEIPAQAAPGVRLVRPPDQPGKLNVLVWAVDDKVIVDFGQPIQWAAFTAEQAENLRGDLEYAIRSARMLYVPPSEDDDEDAQDHK